MTCLYTLDAGLPIVAGAVRVTSSAAWLENGAPARSKGSKDSKGRIIGKQVGEEDFLFMAVRLLFRIP
jgi:hypothetical protein